MRNVLKTFIVGSSLPVCICFYIIVNNIKDKNYSYFIYSILCPLYFGILNIISYCVSKYFKLTTRLRFLITSIFSFIIPLSVTKLLNIYDFNYKEWYLYYLVLFSGHFITWNVIIYNLEKYI